jgi:hypothetical protein
MSQVSSFSSPRDSEIVYFSNEYQTELTTDIRMTIFCARIYVNHSKDWLERCTTQKNIHSPSLHSSITSNRYTSEDI